MRVVCLGTVLLFSVAVAAPPAQPGAERQRAYDDLAAFYAGKAPLDATAVVAQLARGDASDGRYVAALLAQALADESNGRAAWHSTPYWGGGAESKARTFRSQLATALGDGAAGDAALDAALWLIESEPLADAAAAGMKVLRRTRTQRADDLLRALVIRPLTSRDVLVGVIEEVGVRKLVDAAPAVARLGGHHRTSVRAAAGQACAALACTPASFRPEAAFSPSLEAVVRGIAAMAVIEPRPDMTWGRFASKDAHAGAPWSGWLLGTVAGRHHVVTWWGEEVWLDAQSTTMTPRPLADDARELIASRQQAPDGAALSRRGPLTGQFEAGFISVPEAFVAAWLFVRGDRATAAALLLPRLDVAPDDRWLSWAVRDALGHVHHQAMLHAFSIDRDYATARRFARQLATPLFDGYEYQARAKQLAGELAQRADDFVGFTLPEPAAWAAMKQRMSRTAQIDYLADRLRLLTPPARRSGAGSRAPHR